MQCEEGYEGPAQVRVNIEVPGKGHAQDLGIIRDSYHPKTSTRTQTLCSASPVSEHDLYASQHPCPFHDRTNVCLDRPLLLGPYFACAGLLVMGRGPFPKYHVSVVTFSQQRGLTSKEQLTVRSFTLREDLSSLEALGSLLGIVLDGFETPIISSSRRFCFCSGVSFQAELSPEARLGPRAFLPVLKPRGRCLVGSIRAARSSCFGGIVIHSSPLRPLL